MVGLRMFQFHMLPVSIQVQGMVMLEANLIPPFMLVLMCCHEFVVFVKRTVQLFIANNVKYRYTIFHVLLRPTQGKEIGEF
jgi:hypothetical protein